MFAIVVCLSFGTATSIAQTTEQPVSGEEAQAPTEEATREDPFSAETIFDQSATEGAQRSRQRRFVPAAVPQRLPEMRLRGIGRSRSLDPPTVLLEIANHGIFVVSQGDTITLQSARPENVIRIREITDISVILEVGTFGEVIELR
ncbi:MAG: hypothetical protein AAGH74_01230 [Pseudomonadota bacterium]